MQERKKGMKAIEEKELLIVLHFVVEDFFGVILIVGNSSDVRTIYNKFKPAFGS